MCDFFMSSLFQIIGHSVRVNSIVLYFPVIIDRHSETFLMFIWHLEMKNVKKYFKVRE